MYYGYVLSSEKTKVFFKKISISGNKAIHFYETYTQYDLYCIGSMYWLCIGLKSVIHYPL